MQEPGCPVSRRDETPLTFQTMIKFLCVSKTVKGGGSGGMLLQKVFLKLGCSRWLKINCDIQINEKHEIRSSKNHIVCVM